MTAFAFTFLLAAGVFRHPPLVAAFRA